MKPATMPAALALVAGVALGGCAVTTAPLQRSDIAHSALQPQSTPPALACRYRAEVLDGRPTGGVAGNLGRNALALPDAAGLVRGRLAAAGFDRDPASSIVALEIGQLYLAENRTTKVPVAVYRVSVGGETPWIVRAQGASLSWNGSREEGLRALARTLDDADARLIAGLNARCGHDTGG